MQEIKHLQATTNSTTPAPPGHAAPAHFQTLVHDTSWDTLYIAARNVARRPCLFHPIFYLHDESSVPTAFFILSLVGHWIRMPLVPLSHGCTALGRETIVAATVRHFRLPGTHVCNVGDTHRQALHGNEAGSKQRSRSQPTSTAA